jgi:hypothetical protein
VPVLNAKERISVNLIAQEALYTALTTSNANLTITRSKHKSVTKQPPVALRYRDLAQSSSNPNLLDGDLILDLPPPNPFYRELAAS